MAHTYDTKANNPRTRNSGNPVTFNYTCGSGATLLVLTIVTGGSADRTGGAPTYNGVALSQADQNRKAASGPETVVELWYLFNPPTGASYQISIPDTNNVYITCEASSYKAASGYTSALRTAGGATGTSTNPTGPTHTGLAAGDVIVAVVGNGATTWAPSGRTGVQLYDVDDGQYGDGAQYLIKTDGNNQALSWTFGTSEDWAIVSAVFRENPLPIAPSLAAGRGASAAPTVVLGSVMVAPGEAAAIGAGIDPAVQPEAPSTGWFSSWFEKGWFEEESFLSITPSEAAAFGISIAPVVILGSIQATPTAGSARGRALDPIAILGSLTLGPAVSTAIGSGIDPTVETSLPSVEVEPAPALTLGATAAPTVVLGSLSLTAEPSASRGLTQAPGVILGSLTLAPTLAGGRAFTGAPSVILGSLSIAPAISSGIGATADPSVVITGNLVITPSPATAYGKTAGPSLNSHDTRSLGSISNPAGLYLGANSSGTHALNGTLDLVRLLKGRAVSTSEAAAHRRIILGWENGSSYPEVGSGLAQYWAFLRLAQYYFLSNDAGAQAILENWLAWLDAVGAPDGSGWKFPTFFSEYGFGYGSFDPGGAASLALGCLYAYLRGGHPGAATWARRILDDLRLNRQSQDYGGGYKSDYHYAWVNALVIQAFGVAAYGLTGQAYPFPSLTEDAAHFEALINWLFDHAGDAKPNLLNADLIPFTYLEDQDVWDYAPHYVFMSQMGSLEALVLMLGAALAYGKTKEDWTWFERLWRFVLLDNLVVLDTSRICTLTADYHLAGVRNLVRLCFADYDQDNTKYCEVRDEAAVAAWGEAALDVDLRYDQPVILEDPEVAQLLAARLLKRLSSPWEVVHLDTWLEGARLEIGDTLAVTSPFHGFTREGFTVFGKSVDLKKGRVNLDLARPFGPTWAWAVDVEGTAYDASALDQASPLDGDWTRRAYAV